MRTDAKSLFLVCLIALFAMLGWRGYVEYNALRTAREAARSVQQPATLPTFPPYEGLGILEYVAAQSQPDARALPVDLFRPTFDAMVSNLVHEILTNPELLVEAPPEPVVETNPRPTLRPGEENLFEIVQQPNGQWVRRSRQAPAPELTYNGVFKRTDGRIAAWITEKASRSTKFYGEGDELFGGRLKTVAMEEVVVVLPDGEERTLPRGGSLTFPAPPPTVEEVLAPASRDGGGGHDRGSDRRSGGQGMFRRGGPQRMPTEEELAAIERANPQLAQQIRDAIRRRREQDRQRGANP